MLDLILTTCTSTVSLYCCKNKFLYNLSHCIIIPPAQSGMSVQREVTLTLKHGVEAKSWEDVSHISFSMQITKLHSYVQASYIQSDFFTGTLFVSFQLAKAEKLKPMELELRKLEDLAESIVNDFAYMRAREEEMRDTNGGWLVSLYIQRDLTNPEFASSNNPLNRTLILNNYWHM